jgi:hypothetical protein
MNKFEKILLSVFFIELFVGGGGRLIDFHVLSIRQLLFLLLLATHLYRIVKEKAIFNKDINTYIRFNPVTIGVYCLIAWFVVSGIIGILHGHPKGQVATNFFRVSYFVLYFPLAYYIAKDRFSLKRIITILKYSALVVAIFTIVVSILGKTIFSGDNFYPFYQFMNRIMNDDLYFRPSNSVFYKSHFYVLVGLVLCLNDLLTKNFKKVDIFTVVLGTISIIWSETRGLLLAFLLSVLMIIILDAFHLSNPVKGFANKVKMLFQSKQFLKKFIILLVIMLAVPVLYQNMTLERFGNMNATHVQKKGMKQTTNAVNDVSVNNRLKFIVDSKRILSNPSNLIIGAGYATTIAGRTTGIEMSFLQILVEQGIIGFATWLFLFYIFYHNYFVAFKKGYKFTTLDISFMAVFMGILLLTNINPFINNPIGIGFFLVLLVSSQKKKEVQMNEEFV